MKDAGFLLPVASEEFSVHKRCMKGPDVDAPKMCGMPFKLEEESGDCFGGTMRYLSLWARPADPHRRNGAWLEKTQQGLRSLLVNQKCF